MRLILLVHILAGGLGLVTGYVALYAAKGAPLHRKAGIVFVYAMLTMAMGGMVVCDGEGRGAGDQRAGGARDGVSRHRPR